LSKAELIAVIRAQEKRLIIAESSTTTKYASGNGGKVEPLSTISIPLYDSRTLPTLSPNIMNTAKVSSSISATKRSLRDTPGRKSAAALARDRDNNFGGIPPSSSLSALATSAARELFPSSASAFRNNNSGDDKKEKDESDNNSDDNGSGSGSGSDNDNSDDDSKSNNNHGSGSSTSDSDGDGGRTRIKKKSMSSETEAAKLRRIRQWKPKYWPSHVTYSNLTIWDTVPLDMQYWRKKISKGMRAEEEKNGPSYNIQKSNLSLSLSIPI
jgi:hypothetical protein